MEVLIATFVLSIGLLGLASLLPLGRFAVVETNKADYSGACGRAALRDVEIRRMLYPYDISTGNEQWVYGTGAPTPAVADCFTYGAFAIDPLGWTSGAAAAANTFGVLPRVNLLVPGTAAAFTSAQAQQVFLWKDDLAFTVPENSRARRNFYDGSNNLTTDPTVGVEPVIDGQYSWLATVTPATAENNVSVNYTHASRRLYKVSVAVCYRRDFANEKAAAVKQFVGGIGFGGGTIVLDATADIKEGQWIFLCGQAGTVSGNDIPAQAKWYRVVSVGRIGSDQALTLQGPDWNVGYHATPAAVVIPTVLGVYTKTIEVDNDPLWSY